jgi:hypothetical protein
MMHTSKEIFPYLRFPQRVFHTGDFRFDAAAMLPRSPTLRRLVSQPLRQTELSMFTYIFMTHICGAVIDASIYHQA